ncbi:hypothetical protein A5784_34985 [Mycobacterium sp. 852013-50091_SCH5140682]|uniref:DUF5131 family protein n=1 Tax=Mycobacterium sp. 852013-50091_SCH5140682 TaxID=1834109 RepID=UPI0007E95C93|nr:phage Gp37/Gp68 family protein [Mycobacterium sp. 852013-50091_SCH5140682]OBC11406.1 hypothetical protein A5784_34985 [Mycobacterium sp. 852013-50091_SCH5140682]
MSDRTKIEWTRSDDGTPGATWNPVTGCTKLSPASPGCQNCYASTFAERWRGTPGHYFERGFDVQLRPEKLDQPLRWTRPRRIFVNSMSDLFHDQVPDDYIANVWAVMARAQHHTFQVLTKRHARMRALLNRDVFRRRMYDHLVSIDYAWIRDTPLTWPLPNVWLGVSTENQQWADIRIPALLNTPAAVRFISAEPLLGPIDLRQSLRLWKPPDDAAWQSVVPPFTPGLGTVGDGPMVTARLRARDVLHWVIVGGESGHRARPMHPNWVRSLHRQCETAGVPFLFKQWGEWTPMAPIVNGTYDFSRGITMTDDGNTYQPGDLDYPDGPRRGEAQRADFPHHHPTSMYRVGKGRAGRELYHDGRTFDEYPAVANG